MLLQIIFACIIFGLFTMIFATGMMGGGAVKLLGALALWLPWQPMLMLLLLMSVLGGVVTVITVLHPTIDRRICRPEIPYRVASAFAGLWVVGERFFNPFA